MLPFKLTLERFMNRLEKERLTTGTLYPILHYSENESRFFIYFKGSQWNYFTEVIKSNIEEFGVNEGRTKETAINEFRINFLSNAVKVELDLFEKLYLSETYKSIDVDKIKDIPPKPKKKDGGQDNKIEDGDLSNKSTYNCECIECGHKQTSDKHCSNIKCSKCGGEMRRLERPGPGKNQKEREITKDTTEEEIIKLSKSYDDFIVKSFTRWEEKAIVALNKIEVTKEFDLMEKTFGEFLQALFNGITSMVFLSGVKKFVKNSMLEGHEAAEKDIDKNIDISLAFDAKVKALSDQELNGYTISGKKWHGMKGVTAELRQDILNSIRDGVINKESRSQLNQRVKDLFGSAKDAQAERIARTETNRFLNEGKLQSYTDSGVEGRKTWLNVDDDRSSDICKRLNAKYGTKGIGFDEPFLDEKTGKEFMNPPAHPHCRSIIGFALEEE